MTRPMRRTHVRGESLHFREEGKEGGKDVDGQTEASNS
jgi:hypothetical protein